MELTKKEYRLVILCINEAISKNEEYMRLVTDKDLKEVYAQSCAELLLLKIKILTDEFGDLINDLLEKKSNKP